jgi:hypothetical protein
VERYGDRSVVIDKRKSLIDGVIQLSFLVGTIVALCGRRQEDFESINNLPRILKKYETNVHNNSQREAVPVDRVQLSFHNAQRLSGPLRKTDSAFFSRY